MKTSSAYFEMKVLAKMGEVQWEEKEELSIVLPVRQRKHRNW
jgi:hypothetical protein